MKYICFLLACFLSIGLWSCEDCGVRSEPRLEVNLYNRNRTLLRIDTVYAPTAKSAFFKRSGGSFYAPLNLNADSTQYVVVVNGQRETLTVRYRRDFSYKSSRCGYVLDLFAPTNQPNATFPLGRIENASYIQNKPGNLLNYRQDTGIYLTVSL